MSPSTARRLLAAGVLAALAAAVVLLLTPRPWVARAQLSLSVNRVSVGGRYFAVVSGFEPGEDLQFSWTGRTSAVIGVFSADPDGRYRDGPILERDPPGQYAITATGRRSGRVASAPLWLLPAD